MTTPQAAARYEAEHVAHMSGRGYAVHNPNGAPVEALPVIYGFNNGGEPGWMSGVLIAEDGICVGGHICSSESYMPHDLGILDGSRPDRHESFRKKYPGGYRMEFVASDEVKAHEGLQAAFELNAKQAEADSKSTPTTA